MALGIRQTAGAMASVADGQSQGLLPGLQSLSPYPKSVGVGGLIQGPRGAWESCQQ